MEPTVTKALGKWQEARDKARDHAVRALCLALPGLARSDRLGVCCPTTLTIDSPDTLARGRVCVDDDGRVSIAFDAVPNAVLTEGIDAVFGAAWGDGPLVGAAPGTYCWDSEEPHTEFTVEVGAGAKPGSLDVGYLPVDWAGEILDALTAARDRQEREAVTG
ncbi:hypothetical protein [Streptomyces sp. NPDC097619]|uniref:hypothetical protein n=1 Tax=Streptomyces sp. NPDC097619 TaxID=3157228 RepID=UPI0033202CFB